VIKLQVDQDIKSSRVVDLKNILKEEE